jgi:hypothetical protein
MSPSKSHNRRSQRYRDLQKEVSTLRRLLLPSKLSATGLYPLRVYTKVLSFRVLAHAEIEAFLEDRVRELCLESMKKYKTHGRITTTTAALLAFSGLELKRPPQFVVSSKPHQQTSLDEKLYIEKKLERAASSFYTAVDSNHGLKEKNLLMLLLPVGIDPASLDSVWLQSMNSFGSDRGMVAHSTRASYGATALPDPGGELKRIRYLITGLRDVDRALNRLLAE